MVGAHADVGPFNVLGDDFDIGGDQSVLLVGARDESSKGVSFGLRFESNKGSVSGFEGRLIASESFELGVFLRNVGRRGFEGHLLSKQTEEALFPSGSFFDGDESVGNVSVGILGVELAYTLALSRDVRGMLTSLLRGLTLELILVGQLGELA